MKNVALQRELSTFYKFLPFIFCHSVMLLDPETIFPCINYWNREFEFIFVR